MYSILVCDDEKDIVSALKIYLMADGYQVFEAYNGKEALEVLKEPKICSIIRDNNTASIHVAERNGLKPAGSFVKHYYGIEMPHIIYSN